MLGAPASHPDPLEDAIGACLGQRLAFVVFSDGEDAFGIFADPGDSAEAVQRQAVACMPWGAAS